jgi:hypothetical protein
LILAADEVPSAAAAQTAGVAERPSRAHTPVRKERQAVAASQAFLPPIGVLSGC